MSSKHSQQHSKQRWLTLALCTASTIWRAEPPHAAAQAALEGPAAALPSSAPQPAEPPAEYYRAVDLALAEHERRHFEEARAHFQRAHDIFPNARTLRGLGKVEFELRNYGEAVKFLNAALASSIRPLDMALRTEAQNILDVAKAYVGEVRVKVEPDTATVSVDGVTVAAGPDASFSLVVGDHVLEFRALGRVPERRSIRVRAGEPMSMHVVLASPFEEAQATVAKESGVKLAPPASEHVDDGNARRRKIWIWSAVGVVAAVALGVGLGVGLSGRTRTEDPITSANTPDGLSLGRR